jgi:hypothetical protein
MLMKLAQLAEAYGRWPHEVLELDAFQEGLALACLELRLDNAIRMAKGGGVFPVIQVGRV